MLMERIKFPSWCPVISKQMICTESDVRLLEHERSKLNMNDLEMIQKFYPKNTLKNKRPKNKAQRHLCLQTIFNAKLICIDVPTG